MDYHKFHIQLTIPKDLWFDYPMQNITTKQQKKNHITPKKKKNHIKLNASNGIWDQIT